MSKKKSFQKWLYIRVFKSKPLQSVNILESSFRSLYFTISNLYCLFFPSQAEFKTRVVIVRERMSSKEQEVTGKWLTEEKLKGDYSQ